MNETRTFEISNYRKGTTLGFITLEDGSWSADTEVAQGILTSVQETEKTEEKMVEYFSNHTNQVMSIREVGAE